MNRAIAYIRLSHFVPTLAVLIATSLFAWVLADDPPPDQLLRMLLAMLGVQVLIGVVNELVDAERDAVSKPDKPIPAGLVSRRGAVLIALLATATMLLVGASLGSESFVLLLLGTTIGVTYSLWFKESRFAWLPYLLALPLLPIWVAVTLDAWDRQLLWLYPLGIGGGFAIHLAQAAPDVAADRLAGINSLTTRLGETTTLRLCWGLQLASALALLVLAAIGIEVGWEILVACLLTAALVLADIALYKRNARRGVMAAFPCCAAAIGMLALAWVAGV